MPSHVIKICGLTTPDTVAASIEAGASMLGFVFFERSPRHLGTAQAAALVQQVPETVRTVGLMVNPDDEAIRRICHHVPLDILQIHLVNDPARLAHIRTISQKPVYAAAGISSRADLFAARAIADASDGIFYDAKPPDDASVPGGRGVAFDWSIMAGFNSHKPWILAGGLTPDTVTDAITITGTRGVDVSSGVEQHPGIKDIRKIKAFVYNAKQAFADQTGSPM